MSYNKPLVPTTEEIAKEDINDTEAKRNVVKTAITHQRGKNEIGTVNKADKPQESKSKNINL